jgi:sugar diacid utilization regulator
MLDAVLSGSRLQEVADLAARAVSATVAIIVPSAGIAVIAPTEAQDLLPVLGRFVDERVAGREPAAALRIACEVPIGSKDDVVGAVLLIEERGGEVSAETRGILQVAAMASLTDLALQQAKEDVEDSLRGSFVEELRAGMRLDAPEVIRRAGRLGCDLTRGAVVLAVAPKGDRPHLAVATIRAEAPEAFVQNLGGRIYAILPCGEEPDEPDAVVMKAKLLAERVQAHAHVGVSPFEANAAELGRAIAEADLVVDVLGGPGHLATADVVSGTYRLLLWLLATRPGEVRAFHDATIAPLVRYDERYQTDLLGTLATYLEHDGNINATARTMYAHRHTIAYRLERIRDLTELDPARSEGRERLGLGLKVHNLLLHRAVP